MYEYELRVINEGETSLSISVKYHCHVRCTIDSVNTIAKQNFNLENDLKMSD